MSVVHESLSERAPSAAEPMGRVWMDAGFSTVVLLVPLVLRFVLSFGPEVDPDIWWHLAAGRWMLDHHEVPKFDPFMAGGIWHDWLNYSWAFDILLWLGHRSVALAAAASYAIAMAGLVLLVCAALVRRKGSRPVRRSFVAALGFLALIQHFGPRTYLFTILFTGLTLVFVRRWMRGTPAQRGYWLVPMFVVWANIHLEFNYALFFMALAAFDRWLRRESPSVPGSVPADRSWKPLALLAIGCLAATALNPFGLRLHAMMARMVGPYNANNLVTEMQANSFRSPFDYLLLVLFGGAVFTLARRGARDLHSWGSLAASAYMSFHSQRASWLVVLVSLDILGDLPWFDEDTGPAASGWLARCALPTVVGLSVAAVTVKFIRNREALVPRDAFPYGAVAFVRDRALSGPVYNDWNWGGFLRFQLPNVVGNIDGRGSIFGPDLPLSTMNTWRGRPEWNVDPDLGRTGFVVADRRSALSQLLRYDERFKMAYEDRTSVVFTREAH